MQLRLEYLEKKEELQPALVILHEAIDGIILIILFIQHACLIFRNFCIKVIEKSVLRYFSDREYD